MSDPTQPTDLPPTDTTAEFAAAPEGEGLVDASAVGDTAGEEGAVDEGAVNEGAVGESAEVSNDTAPARDTAESAAEPGAEGIEPAGAEAAPAEAGEAEADAGPDAELDVDSEGDASDSGDDAEPAVVAPIGPIEEISDEELDEDINIDWYILKVQSNRERTSSEALKRKVAIEGLDRYFGDIIVPTEKVTEFKNGKKKTVERKIWPGYIAVQMHVNDDTWFAIRETSGIGDFTGAAGKPIPMSPADVDKILPKEEGEESEDDSPKLNIKFAEGDKVKVTDGNFENFEGEVDSIDQQSGKITVMISIFGRSTPVELEYWQVEKL